eukprot:scaffold12825_cov137-Skeletonema_menzelii.AAC.5
MMNVGDNVWVKCGINGDYEELAVIQKATKKRITVKYIVSGITGETDREHIRPMEDSTMVTDVPNNGEGGRSVRRSTRNSSTPANVTLTPTEIDSDTKSAERSTVAKTKGGKKRKEAATIPTAENATKKKAHVKKRFTGSLEDMTSSKKSVKDAYDEVRHELKARKIKHWKQIKKNNFLRQSQAKEGTSSHPRLPAASESASVGKDCRSTFTIHKASSKKKIACNNVVQVKASSIESIHPPLPKSRTAILQNYSFAVVDEPEMKFTHNIDDNDEVNQEELIEELVELGAKVRTYDFGQPHKEKQFLIDATLNRLDEKKVLPQQIHKRERYYADIAKVSKADERRVRERCQLHIQHEAMIDVECDTNAAKSKAVTYGNIIDSYRQLFCRRCFTYDCNIHGNLPKPNLDLLCELALKKEKEGKWAEIDGCTTTYEQTKTSDSNQASTANCDSDSLSQTQQSICERLYLMYKGDVEKMAHTMGASTNAVQSYVTANKIEFRDPQYVTPKLLKKKRDKVQSYVSMRNYKPEYLNNIQSTSIHPAFIPCDHDGLCDQSNCSCIKNAFFCTKHCGWGSMSSNFFRGCACQVGQCRSSSCSCFAAKRECDPDLCRSCGACTDHPNNPAGDGQRCRNDNISMKRGIRLLVGESSVEGAGLGLFTLHSLSKGDFVDEYVGEIISQEEAERRGVVYDRQNMSYLFNLSSDFSIDATVKGNKTRYANHSDDPNIEPRLIRVNGDSRIGFFAIKDIGQEEELFFDYGYSTEIDNEQLFKPNHAHKFPWMKR